MVLIDSFHLIQKNIIIPFVIADVISVIIKSDRLEIVNVRIMFQFLAVNSSVSLPYCSGSKREFIVDEHIYQRKSVRVIVNIVFQFIKTYDVGVIEVWELAVIYPCVHPCELVKLLFPVQLQLCGPHDEDTQIFFKKRSP